MKNYKEFLNEIKTAINNRSETPFQAFRQYVYLTLDGELNSRVAEVYPFLMKFSTIDYNFLKTELEKTDIWKTYESLSTDNYSKISAYLLHEIKCIVYYYLIIINL